MDDELAAKVEAIRDGLLTDPTECQAVLRRANELHQPAMDRALKHDTLLQVACRAFATGTPDPPPA